METSLEILHDLKIVVCAQNSGQISSPAEVLDLVAACGEFDTDRVLLHEENLSPAFFELKSGLLGEMLLKFSNYRIKAAVVISREVSKDSKFYEFMLETNRGHVFRIYPDQNSAMEWLASD